MTTLSDFNCKELREICKRHGLKSKKTMSEMIKDISDANLPTYKKIEQLGEKGKEGITYLVITIIGHEYAMKSFRKNKSSKKLEEEAALQNIAAEYGVAPEIVEVNTTKKFIVMEKMDKHLSDIIKKRGYMSETEQKQIIKLFKTLDKAKVFHGDTNLLNYMYKGRKLYMIDFGMAKEINSKLEKKLNTSTPNLDIMTIGLVVKLKECGYESNSYNILVKYISDENCKKYGI